MKHTLIDEPKLYFGDEKVNLDPKIGLINFGPYGKFSRGKNQPLTIRAGFIGTLKSKQMLEAWLEKLKYRINGKLNETNNKREVDFPGISLDSPLKFEIVLENDCCEYIDEFEIKKLESFTIKERIIKIMTIYEQKFKDLESSTDPHPDIVLLPIPEIIMDLCKDKKMIGDKIVYERRNQKLSLKKDHPLFDFHNY